MRPDARKTLAVLQKEWEDCTRCSLGERRKQEGAPVLLGEGQLRSVLFVGEGFGLKEEQEQRPFVPDDENLVWHVATKLGLRDFYYTNCVACRSCAVRTGKDGKPLVNRWGRVSYRDESPLPDQLAQCRPRLLEEIYLVDPVVIVSLGAKATQVLTGGNVAIMTERGQERVISIPGAASLPSLTEKKGAWMRKAKGVISYPTVQNEVKYLLIPTLLPAYVSGKLSDKGHDSPFAQFVADIRLAIKIYEWYLQEAHGVEPSGRSDTRLEDIEEDYYD